MKKVYISSSASHSDELWKIAKHNLLHNGESVIEGRGEFNQELSKEVNFYREKVKDSKLFIGIYTNRYGSIAKDNKSWAQLEYEWSQEFNIPSILFLVDPKSNFKEDFSQPDDQAKLSEFKDELNKRKVILFTDRNDLIPKLINELERFNETRSAVGKSEPQNGLAEMLAPLAAIVGAAGAVVGIFSQASSNPSTTISLLSFTFSAIAAFVLIRLSNSGEESKFIKNSRGDEGSVKTYKYSRNTRILLLVGSLIFITLFFIFLINTFALTTGSSRIIATATVTETATATATLTETATATATLTETATATATLTETATATATLTETATATATATLTETQQQPSP